MQSQPLSWYQSLARKMTDHSNPRSTSSRMRAKRMGLLVNLIESIFKKRGSVNILDVGGRKKFWEPIESTLHRNCVKITVLNLPCEIHGGRDDSIFTHVSGDACNLHEYKDGQFDLVLSNSVIEHVGNWDKIQAYATEVRRVGQNLFVQTPYYWFCMEPHYVAPFFHWLPRPIQVKIFMRFAIGTKDRATNLTEAIQWVETTPYLLDCTMMRALFPDCDIQRERFWFMTKSLIAIRRQ